MLSWNLQLRKGLPLISALTVLGAGHMASAILRSLLDASAVAPEALTICDIRPDAAAPFTARGARFEPDPAAAVRRSELVLLAVRPAQLPALLAEVAPVCAGKTLVSIAAGVSTSYIRSLVPQAHVVRVMPNATMMVGRGAIAIAEAPDVPAASFEAAVSLFSAGGVTEIIPESAMNAVVSVNGSSPAYFYRMAAVIAEFAQAHGIDPAVGLRLAAKTMEGAAAVLLSGEQTPEELVRMVATPGGTTQAALDAMTQGGFDEALRAGLEACAVRSAELGR